MRVLGVTLARGGSKGVVNKNIREVAGRPLLAWTIDEALKATTLDDYFVSTDSQEIAAVAKEYGAKVIMRPKRLAEDDTPSLPALLHAQETAGGDFGVVADIRCTNPLKTAQDVDGAVGKLLSTGADVVCGVTQLEDHHPMRIKTIVADRLVDVWPEPESGNRQDLRPDVYIRNGSIYAVRTVALQEGIHFNGGDVRPWIMPLERSINIDTEMDLLVAEVMLNDLRSGNRKQPQGD